MTPEEAARDAEAGRFTHRVTFWEEPEHAEWLTEHAEAWGRSRAGEIRAAIRYWRQANDRDG